MYPFVKRWLDAGLAAVGLVVLLPLMAAIAVLLRCDCPGERVLFSQPRVGRGGTIFTIRKFRTLSEKTGAAGAEITPFCRFLRAWSLDELPQLWNILVGDMSFVGPRPVVPSETALLSRRRTLGATAVRPGLTGLAQVRGRKWLSVEDKARCDAYYCKQVSLSLDMYIVWRTLFCIHSDEPTVRKKPLTNG